MRKLLFLFPLLALFGSSCKVLNPNIMLQTKKDYVFDTLRTDSTLDREYRLSANDIVDFRLFANDGFRIIDISSSLNAQNQSILQRSFEYTIDPLGDVKLPILGVVHIAGMTVREAEGELERRYADYYVKPFSIIRVVNKRVIVFPGNAGQAKVIPLQNNNTTVIEALALAGGITDNGKAYKVKLIRQTGNPQKPKIYKLDLSKIEGIAEGNTVVQANDIIYVEPRRNLSRETLREITPILSLFSSALTIYLLVTR